MLYIHSFVVLLVVHKRAWLPALIASPRASLVLFMLSLTTLSPRLFDHFHTLLHKSWSEEEGRKTYQMTENETIQSARKSRCVCRSRLHKKIAIKQTFN